MPAFQLTRLKTQIGDLSRLFTRPEEFQRCLRDLMELYADWAYRPGEEIKLLSFTPSYRVPPLILRHLTQELGGMCRENPHAALALADVLWRDKYIEPRLLAVQIMGQTPIVSLDAVIEQFQNWVVPGEDNQALDALFEIGSLNLRHEAPSEWLGLIDGWLQNQDVRYQILGLRAMLSVINDPGFVNLPPVFCMLVPIIQECAESLDTSLLIVLGALVKRSPIETAYLFRQQVLNPLCKQRTRRLLRQCMAFFEPETRENFRDIL